MTPAQFYARFRSTMFGIPVPDLPETPPQPDDDLDPLMREYVSGQRMASPNVDRQSASIVNVDNGKYMAAVAICAALCGVSMLASIWAAYTARDAATESRLTQYYLMDPHSRTPEELSAWAKFNREHERER